VHARESTVAIFDQATDSEREAMRMTGAEHWR
jgi:hypothetical protein